MGAKGKGAGKGAGKTQGRSSLGSGRFAGVISEWHGQWGWIVADENVNHPGVKQNKIYLHGSDAPANGGLSVGARVEFGLYSDARGVGACDCRAAGGSDEGPLPEGWEKIWSDEHKEHYFWHRPTKEASWVRPSADGAVAGANDEDLPDGWEKHYDAKQEEWYYWNKATKTASWEAPTQTTARGGRSQTAKKVEREVRPAADGPVLGQQRIRGRVTKWQGFFGWITPQERLSEDLQPLLEKHEDKIYVNWRDVQKGLNMEVGTAVDFLVYADDNGLGAQDVRLQAKVNRNAGYSKAVAALEEEWAQQDAHLGGFDGDMAEEAAAVGLAEPEHDFAEDALEGELLPGWEQVWSDENNCHYYWHKATKTASWERPAVLTLGAPAVKDKVWEGEGSEEGAAKLATPITPFVSKPGREMTPITPAGPKAREEAARATGVPSTPSTPMSGKGKGKGKGGPQTGKGGPQQQAPGKRLPQGLPAWQQPAKKVRGY